MRITRALAVIPVTAAALALASAPAWAGSPHFVGTPAFTTSGSVITVTAKEAGLGDEAQIHVVLAGTAQCVNPGGNDPQAGNKTAFSTAADEPVQSGHADYTLSATAAFQPSCTPPMSVVFSDVVVTDETSGISVSLP
jgi:hypothetical protein